MTLIGLAVVLAVLAGAAVAVVYGLVWPTWKRPERIFRRGLRRR